MFRFTLVVAVWAILAARAVAADRPNIVFIMTDDHAAHAIGAYGSRVNQTPHLDRLAREGALLGNVFATNSICTPSRAAIAGRRVLHRDGRQVASRQRPGWFRPLGDPARTGCVSESRALHGKRGT